MPATPSATLFKKIYALYDGEVGKTYRIQIRQDLGAQTGLGADGNADGGVLTGSHRKLRHAIYKGVDANADVHRHYPCSRQYWIDHQDLNHVINMDGVQLKLTGFVGERTH